MRCTMIHELKKQPKSQCRNMEFPNLCFCMWNDHGSVVFMMETNVVVLQRCAKLELRRAIFNA